MARIFVSSFATTKNPTPRELALATAGLVAVVLGVLLLLLKLFVPAALTWYLVVGVPALTFIAGYIAFAEALRRFIYRKIKLIYKTIHRLKTPKTAVGNKIDLRKHIIDEVQREVNEWAKIQSREIETLKHNEQFRREFVGNVSHELKTPIFNLQGYLYTLLDSGAEDEEIRQPYLQKCIQNVERLITIVEDLNIISQLESDRLHLEYKRFNILELAQEVFEEVKMRAQEKNIRLFLKEGANRPYFVYADRDRIWQVLVNLVSNAVKYGRQNGRVSIAFYDMDSNVLVEVADNGVGIASEHIPRLFERFYRVDKGRSRDQGGTGLGLSIVKHIIEAHQQTINVRSTPEVGSTFGFTLEKARFALL